MAIAYAYLVLMPASTSGMGVREFGEFEPVFAIPGLLPNPGISGLRFCNLSNPGLIPGINPGIENPVKQPMETDQAKRQRRSYRLHKFIGLRIS